MNSKILEKRVKELKEKFNELIRIERIKRKI
ncbi:STK_08120 family protein [Acidianus infernus]